MSELLNFECADKRKINIPVEVGTKFTQFGAILLPQDQSGARVKNMASLAQIVVAILLSGNISA